MAKRLTDTEKWNDDWYLSLNNDYRVVWQWLLDNCNHAGICKRNIRLVNLMCNTEITEEDLYKTMEDRVIPIKNNWFIPKFLKFQYSTLGNERPVIVSVKGELEKHNLLSMVKELFGNDYLIIKDKSKSKDKSKRKDSLTKKTKNDEFKFSGNFKAQGEELFAQRFARYGKSDLP